MQWRLLRSLRSRGESCSGCTSLEASGSLWGIARLSTKRNVLNDWKLKIFKLIYFDGSNACKKAEVGKRKFITGEPLGLLEKWIQLPQRSENIVTSLLVDFFHTGSKYWTLKTKSFKWNQLKRDQFLPQNSSRPERSLRYRSKVLHQWAHASYSRSGKEKTSMSLPNMSLSPSTQPAESFPRHRPVLDWADLFLKTPVNAVRLCRCQCASLECSVPDFWPPTRPSDWAARTCYDKEFPTWFFWTFVIKL